MVEGDYSIIVTPEAMQKIENIFKYYQKEVSDAVANRIKSELYNEITSLTKMPESKSLLRSKKQRNPRIRFVRKMSFKILFQVYSDIKDVVILDLIHDRENPSKWDLIS